MQLLTDHALAMRLMTTPANVRRMVREAGMPHVELPNGEMRFDVVDVMQWLRSRGRGGLGGGGEVRSER